MRSNYGGLPISARSRVQARACSLRLTPRPGRVGTIMRPPLISRRSLNSGSSQSKCSTQGSVGIGRAQVHVQLHREVRAEHQAGVFGLRGDLQERRDAADARRVGHQVVGGAVADQLAVFGGAGQHLAGGDGRVESGRQRGMAFVVVGVERLFDPDQVELLEDAAHALRGRAVPLLVGVDHQRHVVAEVLAHRFDALDVERAVGLADLELDAADAALDRGRGIDHQLVERRVQEPARGVVAGDRVAVRTQQLGQRQAGALGLQVVQRHVEGADGLRGHAAAARPTRRPSTACSTAWRCRSGLRRSAPARSPSHARTGPGRRRASSS